jgi:arsenate reductase-like glutaredoxin family protein
MTCRCVPSVEVTIYSTPTSVEGQQVRDFFSSKGVPYEEFDVSADPQALQRFRELSGQTHRPVIVVNDRVYVGFDRSQMESAVPSLF